MYREDVQSVFLCVLGLPAAGVVWCELQASLLNVISSDLSSPADDDKMWQLVLFSSFSLRSPFKFCSDNIGRGDCFFGKSNESLHENHSNLSLLSILYKTHWTLNIVHTNWESFSHISVYRMLISSIDFCKCQAVYLCDLQMNH